MDEQSTFDLAKLFGAYASELKAGLDATRGMLWHPYQKGAVVEHRFRELLRKVLPARYGVSEGMVYDSTGARSKQCDVIIFDAMNAPVIFNENGTRAVPNEAVFAVIEVKTSLKASHLQDCFEAAKQLRQMSKSAVLSSPIEKTFQLTDPPLNYFPTLYYIFAVETEEDNAIANSLSKKVESAQEWKELPNMIWIISGNTYCYYGRKTYSSTDFGIISFYTTGAKVYKLNNSTGPEFPFALLFDLVLSAEMYTPIKFLPYFGDKSYEGTVVN